MDDEQADKERVSIHHPHDSFVRYSLGRVDIVASLVRDYLPADLVGGIDLESLEITKESYVDQDLASHYSDIVYRLRIAGQEALIYLLFEHKSYSDQFAPYQLFTGIAMNTMRHRVNREKAKESVFPLPVTVPVLLYHGAGEWPWGNRFSSLFDPPPACGKYIPDFVYETIDVSHMADDDVVGEVVARVFLFALRCALQPIAPSRMEALFNLFGGMADAVSAKEYFDAVIKYLFAALPEANEEDILQSWEKAQLPGGYTMPGSIAEKYLEQGMEKGLEKGMEKGMEKGKSQDALKMIEKGCDDAFIQEITGLSAERIRKLREERRIED
ncbi:MAG: hypothetical protein GF344_10785 [Chitinivibrionales bacterium]|nr:hypothetical protein [Chitinivibrionales bacterium]MBD3357289.1 hypothetical protein [Chitinivibrionales bacterium]